MSFMFNPHPYDDPTAINQVALPSGALAGMAEGTVEAARSLAAAIRARAAEKGGCVAALDGYPTAEWDQTEALLERALAAEGIAVEVVRTAELFRSPERLEQRLSRCLPDDRIEDPVLLYGRLDHEGFAGLFDEAAVDGLVARVQRRGTAAARRVLLIVGCGAAEARLRPHLDLIAWFDVTPKQAVLRVRAGRYRNLGDRCARPFKEAMRRCYYIDFEAAGRLRGELLRAGAIDCYVCADDPDHLVALDRAALAAATAALARQPFRCRPVYLEGVWGGHYVSRVRRLPPTLRNVAWVFDLIPLEVSVVIHSGPHRIEMPFFTFVQLQGEAIMGAACVRRFGGYFPVRLNYDDTFHSSGNMSIQVHPGEDYARDRFNELGRQDESYYVVAAGHGAKTYCGFRDDADPAAFFAAARVAEESGVAFDHDRYVAAHPSRPGMQFLLPAGTVHASGRNQLILEIGSLTVGSYTFKLYDYLRADLDGARRPIHLRHGERSADRMATAGRIAGDLIQEPTELRRGEGFVERRIGRHDRLYFALHEIELSGAVEDDTRGGFHVLVVVDGERVRIESMDDPGLGYDAGYLDMVVVPAGAGRYRVRNLGPQPVRLHKTVLAG